MQSARQVLPLVSAAATNHFAWWRTGFIDQQTFLGHVEQLGNALPAGRFILNLCEDRYLFIVAFAALLMRGQVNLLPPSRAQSEVAKISVQFSAARAIYDADVRTKIASGQIRPAPVAVPADIPSDHTAAIVFTSGSTGQSQAHAKSWRSLYTGAALAAERFHITAATSIVATVPPQHMYGLETSVLLPLYSGASIYGGRPFFPADLCAALARMSEPRCLVTTPAHLRICVKSAMDWPPLNAIISATAPLSDSLAQSAERIFGAPVNEIYGCTEGGSLASRRTLNGNIWLTYGDICVKQAGDRSEVSGGHLSAPAVLSDRLEVLEPQRFRLLGRAEDMINVAGKRASLAYLNLQINSIAGVEDGVFFPAENVDNDLTDKITPRLTALVVAPTLSEQQILTQLGKRLDTAFLPRPLYKVSRLPRNEIGKLPRRKLLQLIRNLQQGRNIKNGR